jgi:hypothetical protein
MSNNGHNQEARETIQSFINRYAPLYPNGDHVELIQLAAFPVAVTVHLLYQIWANFGTFIRNGVACKIDALAVNDCIQSNLFRQTGPDLFEMDADVRQCLLEALRANRGKQFVKEELAAFLYQYSRQNTQGNAWRNYYDAQQWTAIMEVDEKAAAEQILSSLEQELQKKNTSRGLGIVNLIAALEKDNKQFSGLLRKALNNPDTLQAEPGTVTSKRIVLTDEIVDGRTPVRINLPPSLSNRLKKIVKTDQPVIEKREGTVYGLFVDFVNERHESRLFTMADLFAEKQYMPRANATFLGAEELEDLRNSLNTLLSASKVGDRIIIYLSCALNTYAEFETNISPKELNIFIKERFPDETPDVILILDAYRIGPGWLELKNPLFMLIATGNESDDYFVESRLFEDVLKASDRDTTYVQFYNTILQKFVQENSHTDIFSLPHLMPGKLDWNYRLFSRSAYTPLEEVKKMLSDMGREHVTENELAGLNEILEAGIKSQGRNKAIPLLKIVLNTSLPNKGANCMWLLQQEYDFDVDRGPKGIFSQTALWNNFFSEIANEETQDVLGIVRLLLATHILFIGLSQTWLSGLNFLRMKTIISICRARRILLYFILEENCSWQQLDIEKNELLLDEMILQDYLRINGSSSFLKVAYKEIEDALGEENPAGNERQGKTYGMFVGINNYADKQFNLHESVGDAKKMLNTLVSTQLLESENTSLILDKNATRGNVVNPLLERLSTAKSEDTILFYFSGHSSNQQTDSALFFHDLDRTSEYTSKEQNGILTDFEFNEMVKAAPNNPTIILILDTHGGSRNWLDESNPKHISMMATHLEEVCYETGGIGGMFTEALTQCLTRQPGISYIELYQSVLNRFLTFAHDKSLWQTPLFIVDSAHWNDIFLSKTAEAPNTAPRNPKTYEYLQTRNTLQCLYYSQTERGAFTFYNQVKFALYEKRIEFEHLDTWTAIEKSLSVHNRFPDMIFIALKESMYAYKPKYNIEKLLTIADVMQIPVYFMLEDEKEPDPSVYKSYPLLPADKKPVLAGEDVDKIINQLETVMEPLLRHLRPIEEDVGYETWVISIGLTHYQNLPALPAGVQNSKRFSDWASGKLKNKVSPENCFTFISGSDLRITKNDIDKTVIRLTSRPNEKRVLYFYVCGHVLKNTDDLLLCLPSWTPDKTYAIVNITEYFRMISNAGFARVVVFVEYNTVDMSARKPNELFHNIPQHPAPSCLFKVPMKVNDDFPSQGSIVLDGLYGEAAGSNNRITTGSFKDYVYKRSGLEGIHQSPEVRIENADTGDFIIADLDPAFNRADNTGKFKQKWVLIVGTGKASLSQPEWLMSNALARELAKSGYGIITGGWPGVDAVAAEAYAGQLAEEEVIDEGYLVQVVLEEQVPAYPGGLIERVANETQAYDETLEKAYALIMIGGIGGTYVSYRRAEAAGIPVIPIASTGGDAAKAHTVIKDRRLLPAYFLSELAKPLKSYEDATRTADAICNFLDEGFGKHYYTPNPA